LLGFFDGGKVMNQAKKAEVLEQINDLLNELNKSIVDQGKIKDNIQVAYNQINKPEKDSQKYKQVSDAVNEMIGELQRIALKKIYHFDEHQNDLINKLSKLAQKSISQSGIGIINAVAWGGGH